MIYLSSDKLEFKQLEKLELGDDFNEKEKNNFSNWHISLRFMG